MNFDDIYNMLKMHGIFTETGPRPRYTARGTRPAWGPGSDRDQNARDQQQRERFNKSPKDKVLMNHAAYSGKWADDLTIIENPGMHPLEVEYQPFALRVSTFLVDVFKSKTPMLFWYMVENIQFFRTLYDQGHYDKILIEMKKFKLASRW